VFAIEDTNTYYANSLRRTIISDVPTLAIDTVNVLSNTSILTDEILAHRLGLVVINSDILLKEGDNDVAADMNTEPEIITFSLNVRCDQKEMYVTAGMIKTNNPEVHPVHDDTIVVKLYRGDEIILGGTIEKGIGRTHAKWMSVSVIGYNIKYLDKQKMKIYLTIEPVGSLSAKTILSKARTIVNNLKTQNGNPENKTQKGGLNKFKKGYLV